MKNRLLADIQSIRRSISSRMGVDKVTLQGAFNQLTIIEIRFLELKDRRWILAII